MNKNRLIWGMASLVVALVFLLAGITKWVWEPSVSVYPAGFFALVAVVQIIRAFYKPEQKF
jgi:hypothetical protein